MPMLSSTARYRCKIRTVRARANIVLIKQLGACRVCLTYNMYTYIYMNNVAAIIITESQERFAHNTLDNTGTVHINQV